MALAQFLLTFREVFEAALLAAIVLAFLVRTRRERLVGYAWYGVYGAVGASFATGLAILWVYGALSKASQVLFEGVAALLAVAVLTSMIIWMATKGRTVKREVESRVEAAVTQGAIASIFTLTFVLVFREGLETVLFLTPFLVTDFAGTLLGSTIGLAAGIVLSYAIFRLGMRLDLRKFFFFTSILLVLVASGLFGYGVHEMIEYGRLQGIEFGWWGDPAYVLPFSSDNLLHHRGAVGSVLAVMVGYTVRPEWARVIAQVAYLAVALPIVILVYKRPDVLARWTARLKRFRPTPTAAPQDQRQVAR